MWKLSFPAMIGMLMIGINAFVDMAFVGHLVGEEAVSGLSLSIVYTAILFALGMLVAEGSASILSRSIGENDLTKQELVFGNMLAMSLIVGLILIIPAYFSNFLIRSLGAEGIVLQAGEDYLSIALCGGIFTVIGMACNFLIRAEGKIKVAMIITACGMFLNMLLDPIFIKYFDWGIKGAAWATVVSMAIAASCNLYYFASGKASFPINWKKIGIQKLIIKDVMNTGFSSFTMNSMSLVQQWFVFLAIDQYGTTSDIGVFGATLRTMMLAIIPVFGIVRAFQPVVGINFGAKNYKRVREAITIFTIAGVALITLIWIPIILSPDSVIKIILPSQILTADDLLNVRCLYALLPLFPIAFLCMSLYQAIGNAQIATLLSISRQLIIFIPLILLLPKYFGVRGVYLTYFVADAILISICFCLLLYQRHRLSKLSN